MIRIAENKIPSANVGSAKKMQNPQSIRRMTMTARHPDSFSGNGSPQWGHAFAFRDTIPPHAGQVDNFEEPGR